MKRFAIVTLSISLLAITACEELENLCGISADDLGFTEEYNKHLNAAIYIYQVSDLALRDSTLEATGMSQIDGANCTRTPDSLIVDFGNGIVGSDGKTRYGSYRMGTMGNYRDPGSNTAIKLHMYREGDQQYQGMVSLENVTTGTSPEINITVTNMAVDSLSLGGQVLATWLNGFETETDPTDDAFELTGGLTLSNTNNAETFTGTVTSPLHIEYSCDYTFVGGMLDLVPSNTDKYPQLSMDFIAGDCANLFTATLDCDGNNLSFSYPIQ